MPKELVVSGQPFQYPIPGDQLWGEDATDWASAVTDVLNSIATDGFIPQTTSNIADNVTVFTDVQNASFDSTQVGSFQLTYDVVRTDGSSTFAETGRIEGVFNSMEWDYSIHLTGDAGMEFQVTAAGQLQYKSSNIGGTYSGAIRFFANVITN